jgi:kinesin family member 6/9
MSISYMQIYNNSGYDLLDANNQSKNLEDLPKVIPRENAAEELILSGLSVHRAVNEESALNLLFIGDTNRVICETPKNDASTRSHCIFILQVEGKKGGSDIKTVSRLYLVDLSGSESNQPLSL